MLKGSCLCALFLLLSLVPPALSQPSCPHKTGVARWVIKTSVPNQTARAAPVELASLLTMPNPTLDKRTLKQMQTVRLAHPFEFQSEGGAVTLQEGDKVRITGRVVGVACDTDGDIHLSIATQGASRCLIVEVPDPGQVHNGALKGLVRTERKTVLGYLSNGAPSEDVSFEGQLFIDTDHLARAQMGKVGKAAGGGRGKGKCAVNVWEVHPVTLIEQ
jgi:hypothetical protein